MQAIIGVGPTRTCSTWIYNLLAGTGYVAFPQPKEIEFFNRHYNRGMQWYWEQFSANAEHFCDISPRYIDHMATCERIWQAFPDARVVVGVRDPIERLQSSFKLWYRITRSRRIEDYQKFLLDDLHTQLLIANRVEWLAERYGKRLIFVRHEDVRGDAVGTAQKLLTALGLSGAAVPQICEHEINSVHTLGARWSTELAIAAWRHMELLWPGPAWRLRQWSEAHLLHRVELEDAMPNWVFSIMIRPYRSLFEADAARLERLARTGRAC